MIATWTRLAAPGVEACVRYLTNNKEYLCYDEALASGWPIATRVVEGACRHQL